MKESGFVRGVTMGLVAAAAMVMSVDTAQAQSKTTSPLFPDGLSGIEKNRMFMRLGYTNAFIKTKSHDAYDVGGPLVTAAELSAAADRAISIIDACNGSSPSAACNDTRTLEGYVYNGGDSNSFLIQQVKNLLLPSLTANGMTGLGTPPGVGAKAQNSAGTPTVSLGYWLDENEKWLAEAFLLAAPLSVSVYGDGTIKGSNGRPNSLNGKEIVTTKILPPLVIGSYNFLDKNSVARPYLGVGAMYAVFFNAKTTSFMDQYVGGKTSVSTKNAFGAGPFAGIQGRLTDDWHINLSVGQIKLKTTATLVTRDTVISSGSAVLSNYPTTIPAGSIGDVSGAIATGDNVRRNYQTTSALTRLIADARGADNLGTATRKQDLTLTNTIVTFSVGRSF